jgi:Amt family ammonium transporter
VAQATGVAATGVFVSIVSAVVWLVLKFTVGIRVSEEEEYDGLDRGECGLEAYPEFSGR